MKCPVCKAYSDVLETRTRKDSTTRRRYVCGNMHRFTTVEVVIPSKPMKEKIDELV